MIVKDSRSLVDNIAAEIADQLPVDAPQVKRDSLTIETVYYYLRRPRTVKTVRRQFLNLWPLIYPLADREPEQFDAILLEYAERVTTLR